MRKPAYCSHSGCPNEADAKVKFKNPRTSEKYCKDHAVEHFFNSINAYVMKKL